jgi:steroid 5-alpha reductase family enzyme
MLRMFSTAVTATVGGHVLAAIHLAIAVRVAAAIGHLAMVHRLPALGAMLGHVVTLVLSRGSALGRHLMALVVLRLGRLGGHGNGEGERKSAEDKRFHVMSPE